jgi:hypothetical protein
MTKVEGSGNPMTETRTISSATAVSLDASGELTITQGPTMSLTVTADDNILPYLRTEVKDGTLHIDLVGTSAFSSFRTKVPIHFELTLPDLQALAVSGSGTAHADSLTAKELSIAVSGSGDVAIARLSAQTLSSAISGSGSIRVSGEAGLQSVAVSGSGEFKGQDLKSATAEVAVSGSGDVAVWVENDLEAAVSGSGSVSYFGDPRVEREVSGSGQVRSLGPHVVSL